MLKDCFFKVRPPCTALQEHREISKNTKYIIDFHPKQSVTETGMVYGTEI